MGLFTAFVVTSGLVLGGRSARSRPRRPRNLLPLIDQLSNIDSNIDIGETPTLNLPPTPPKGAFTQFQTLAQDLFGDTRQQYQQALDTTYDTNAEQQAEQAMRRNLVAATTGFGLATAGVLVSPLFYLPSALFVLYGTRTFAKEAWQIYRAERRFDYRFIWTGTILAALVSGYTWPAAFSSVFGVTAWYLVAKTENRSKRNIADLFGGQIRAVWLLIDGVEVETPIERVCAGDTIVVHAGQMMPVDGCIVTGAATVDQHMLTGEAQPAELGIGDRVLASTIVLAGRLCVVVEKAGKATVAGQIGAMLSQTTDFKRTIESRTDRWMNRLTLPILGLSAITLPVAGVGGALAVLWYYPGARMIVFGPVSMLSYLQVAAQRGILVKDGRALEVLPTIDTVVFDKTGTLTLEQPTASCVFCYNGVSQSEILRFAAAAEAKQSHPIARAILQAAHEHGLALPLLEDAEYKVGYGLKTQIAGRTTCVGSVRFMRAEGITVPPEVAAQQEASYAQGHSLVLVALDGEVVGAIELQPTIRPEAQTIIAALHQRGIETIIISGDNDAPTRRLAHALGVDRYFAEVLPEDKAQRVMQLQQEGHKICFIGDGINDSLALKTADVAVSLRGATTIATDMAEIVFMDGSLQQLPTLFALADDFATNMRTNLLAATLPGVIGIAGTLLFGWGMMLCVFLTQANMPIGLFNALKPLLDEAKQGENAVIYGKVIE